ncbi:Mur ligase [Algimonas arctica]|uniref:Mur ligase n=1 Tax=Algimonas arctica TaxID=1479486 RepID=A0A8J3G1F4_9PROT|nr:Mur ligase family protein [Algimonas arctica]GHA85494.1 Mur ligase [Algimonas arctica]
MQLTDSRRLTGPSLILDRPGAAAEISVDDHVKDSALARWATHVRTLLDAVGWPDETLAVRPYQGGATLAITAPIDSLFAATEIVEAAWAQVCAEIAGEVSPDLNFAIGQLKEDIAQERDPVFRALHAASHSKGVACLFDEETVTLGLGKTSQCWPRDALPLPGQFDWADIADVPAAMVTGTNGKSTTVRIAAAIGAAAGLTLGFSTSDWVRVGDETIAKGDYSGPEGARLALRDPRVDLAVIETARGGLLRRGLPVPRATACLITNIAADHLGEYGIHTVEQLADAKFTVSKAVERSGTLILNADDACLKSRGQAFPGDVAWYGLSLSESDVPLTGYAAFVMDDHFAVSHNGKITLILPVKEFVPALGGAALYNVSNALGAILLMRILGVNTNAINAGLLAFESTAEDNPGRGNFIDVGGVNVVVDFAHNPHGLSALTEALNTLPAKRRLYMCGQGGDRSDADIYQLTKIIRDAASDAIIVRDMPSKLRGRKPGEVPALIRQYLAEMNYPTDQIFNAETEVEAVAKAFSWAQPGDLLVLLIYENRDKPLGLIQKLQAENWRPGQAVSV